MLLYDGGDARHRALADLGRACAGKVREWLASGVLDARCEIGQLRRRARKLLAEELVALDEIAREVVV